MACQTVRRSVRRSSAATGSDAGEEGVEEDEDFGGFLRRFFLVFRESSLSVLGGSGSFDDDFDLKEVWSRMWLRRRIIWIITLLRLPIR
jgi:hypothetical protein